MKNRNEVIKPTFGYNYEMEKLTNTLPQIRVDEETRKTWDEMALKKRRKITGLMQLIVEDVAILYRKTGVVFTISKKYDTKRQKEND